jgi:hypothetical protein
MATATKIHLPEFSRYSGNNTLVFSLGGVDVYFSYETPIAFRAPTTGLVVRSNDWGPTTGRHLTAIDGGSKERKAARVPGPEFERMLSAVGVVLS